MRGREETYMRGGQELHSAYGGSRVDVHGKFIAQAPATQWPVPPFTILDSFGCPSFSAAIRQRKGLWDDVKAADAATAAAAAATASSSPTGTGDTGASRRSCGGGGGGGAATGPCTPRSGAKGASSVAEGSAAAERAKRRSESCACAWEGKGERRGRPRAPVVHSLREQHAYANTRHTFCALTYTHALPYRITRNVIAAPTSTFQARLAAAAEPPHPTATIPIPSPAVAALAAAALAAAG